MHGILIIKIGRSLIIRHIYIEMAPCSRNLSYWFTTGFASTEQCKVYPWWGEGRGWGWGWVSICRVVHFHRPHFFNDNFTVSSFSEFYHPPYFCHDFTAPIFFQVRHQIVVFLTTAFIAPIFRHPSILTAPIFGHFDRPRFLDGAAHICTKILGECPPREYIQHLIWKDVTFFVPLKHIATQLLKHIIYMPENVWNVIVFSFVIKHLCPKVTQHYLDTRLFP